ncbi:MAG: response regulator [Magnetococcales bacterium]|nr:response regulator [Magnetococcales bacterium]
MKTILCIDDDVVLLPLYRKILENKGFRVMTADNGVTGLALLHHQRIDLLVTDILMPDMDGMQIMLAIRGMKPRPRILAISGGGQYLEGETLLEIAQTMGANETLEKPFTADELFAAIRKIKFDDDPGTQEVGKTSDPTHGTPMTLHGREDHENTVIGPLPARNPTTTSMTPLPR